MRRIVRKYARRPFFWRRNVRFSLYPGDTTHTLPVFCAENPDFQAQFIFIDGGHRVETIASDWRYCSRLLSPRGVLFFDDYYINPELRREYGCNQLIDELRQDPDWRVTIFPVTDDFRGVGPVHVVQVERERKA